jgi:hypothetical protein
MIFIGCNESGSEENVTMNRITKLSIVLYGTVTTLLIMDLLLLVSGFDQNHSIVTILLAFFSLLVINFYIKNLKDQEKKEMQVNKTKFRLIKNQG